MAEFVCVLVGCRGVVAALGGGSCRSQGPLWPGRGGGSWGWREIGAVAPPPPCLPPPQRGHRLEAQVSTASRASPSLAALAGAPAPFCLPPRVLP